MQSSPFLQFSASRGPVRPGSRWTTREALPRKVLVLDVFGPLAIVSNEAPGSHGEIWVAEVSTIERQWTRRVSDTRMRAVSLGTVAL